MLSNLLDMSIEHLLPFKSLEYDDFELKLSYTVSTDAVAIDSTMTYICGRSFGDYNKSKRKYSSFANTYGIICFGIGVGEH